MRSASHAAAGVADPFPPVHGPKRAPAHSVVGCLAVRGALRGPQHLHSRGLEERAFEHDLSEAGEILGSREEATTGPLVTVVHVARVEHPTIGIGSLVEPCPERDQAIGKLSHRVSHAGGAEHAIGHEGEEWLAARSFDHRSDEIPPVGRVGVFGAGLEEQRIVLEDLEAVEHRRIVLLVLELAFLVVPDPREVTCQLPGGDGPALLGKRRNVFLDGSVEVQLALLDQQAQRRGGERLGNTADPEPGQRGGWDLLLQIGHSEAFAPDHSTVFDHRDRGARRAEDSHGVPDKLPGPLYCLLIASRRSNDGRYGGGSLSNDGRGRQQQSQP